MFIPIRGICMDFNCVVRDIFIPIYVLVDTIRGGITPPKVGNIFLSS